MVVAGLLFPGRVELVNLSDQRRPLWVPDLGTGLGGATLKLFARFTHDVRVDRVEFTRRHRPQLDIRVSYKRVVAGECPGACGSCGQKPMVPENESVICFPQRCYDVWALRPVEDNTCKVMVPSPLEKLASFLSDWNHRCLGRAQ